MTIAALPVLASAQVRDRDPALAGQKALASDLQAATFHSGLFYLLSRVQIADIGYDQDFYAPTGNDSTGVSLGISAPQRLYFIPRRKVVFSVDAVPSYSFVSGGDRRGQAGYGIRGDMRFLFNHLYLDTFVSESNQLRANNGELNSLVTQKETAIGLNGELKYSSRTSLTFSGASRKSSFPASRLQPANIPVALLDRHSNGGRISLVHKTFPLTSLRLIASGEHYGFENLPSRTSTRKFGGAGLSFDNGRTSIIAEGGLAALDFRDPLTKDFRGGLGSVQLSRRLSARWSANLGASRDVDFSILQNNGYYVLDRATGTINYAATRRLTLNLISQLGRDQYAVATNGIQRRDRIAYNAIGWSYGLRRLRGGFDIGYYERTTNDPLDDPLVHLPAAEQNGIRVMVHLSFTP
ncbi:MAG TPA: hypothetical protein VN605_08570 [Thermoanaerobaculia bacterium]|nr:hypothetical protein [Thermoanaerobaculia bacterium]